MATDLGRGAGDDCFIDILGTYLSAKEIQSFRSDTTGLFSITVYAEKPTAEVCCAPGYCY